MLYVEPYTPSPEERAEFEELRTGLLNELKPEHGVEMVLFDGLVHAVWNKIRIRRMEGQFFATEPDLIADKKAIKLYEHLMRSYQAAEKSFERALKELKKLQAARVARIPSKAQLAAMPVPKRVM